MKWKRDGIDIDVSDGGTAFDLLVKTSGVYTCDIDGCGLSQGITVTVDPFPFVDIVSSCIGNPSVALVEPVLNSSSTTIGPGGVTYLWSTGEITIRRSNNNRIPSVI